MFYRYEIRNNGKEEILYLYLTMNYEFSNELDNTSKDNSIKEKTEKFIKNNSISYNGNKVYLIVDGIIIKALELKNENNKYTKEKNIIDYSNNNYIINLKYNNQKIEKISLKKYLLGVLATNCINDLELTTLKALCILFRTYAYKKMTEDNYVLTQNEFQIYRPIEYYKLAWTHKYHYIYNKLEKAINDTDKEFVTYENKYILPFIHICNNGKTGTYTKYPYLEKRNSLWDYMSPYYLEIKDFSFENLSTILKQSNEKIKNIKILEITENKYINKIKIGEKVYSGTEIRNILNLKSTDINIIINPTYIRFITKGWGDSLGLSQFGANEIAKIGGSYISIIKYYFPKTIIKKYIKINN